MKYLMFFVTYITLAVVASGCGLQKNPNAVVVIRPSIPGDCYLAQSEGANDIYHCPANNFCFVKSDSVGHILESNC